LEKYVLPATIRGMNSTIKGWYFALLVSGFVFAFVVSVFGATKSTDLVEVTSINPNIVVSLPYATEENFCHQVLYPVGRCFLRRSVAEQLDLVQKDLEKDGYGLKIWDGYRPRSVQYKMWSIKPNTHYVANPRKGSRHNRGAAVDLTLIDLKTREEVAMPTAFDVFNLKAHAHYEKLPKDVLANRRRLQQAMTRHGFQIMKTEWWHFDASGWSQFPLMNTSLEELSREADLHKDVAPLP